jgi:hypothetical protein
MQQAELNNHIVGTENHLRTVADWQYWFMNELKNQHQNDIAKVLGYHDLLESHKKEAEDLHKQFEVDRDHMHKD